MPEGFGLARQSVAGITRGVSRAGCAGSLSWDRGGVGEPLPWIHGAQAEKRMSPSRRIPHPIALQWTELLEGAPGLITTHLAAGCLKS